MSNDKVFKNTDQKPKGCFVLYISR